MLDHLKRYGASAMLSVFAVCEYGYEVVATLIGADRARVFYISQGALAGAFFWLAMLILPHPMAKVIAVGGVVEQTLVVSCAAIKLYQPPPWVRQGESMCDSVLGFQTYPVGMFVMTLYAFVLSRTTRQPWPTSRQ